METSAPKRRRTSPRTALQIQPESQVSPNAPPSAETPDSTGGLTRALRTQLDLRSAKRDAGSAVERGQTDGANAGKEDKGLRSPARRATTKRAIPRPVPRPLPPPAPEEAAEASNPFARRGLRRSPPLGVLPEVVIPEPELPPTPERPDPVVSTPPSGIHNTPSRRPKRSKALAEKIKSSSPLKQPPLRPEEPGQLDHSTTQPPKSPSKKGKQPSPSAPPEPTIAELRGLKPTDPDADKKKLLNSLQEELASLEKDLDLATAENERLRQNRLAKKEASPPPNSDEILSLLRRHALPPEKEPLPTPTDDWLALALNPISFLPFSKPPAPEPAVPDNLDKPIVSHHPLPMTASESLPYLRAFTPLSFTSQIFPLPRQEGEPLVQQHFITVASAKPCRGLFTARMEMRVNTKTLGVMGIQVPRMDPPGAEGELAPFMKQIIDRPEEGVVSSGLYNNISVLTWAMGEWVRVGVERAKVWRVLEEEVGDKRALGGMVKRLRERKRKNKQSRGRKRRSEEDEEDGDEEEEDKERYDAGELLPYMGKTCLDLEVPVLNGKEEGVVSGLRVMWKIEFDWTGEARSDIGVLVGMPGKWHKHDERGQLSGIPRLFDELIRGGEEPLTAVRTVVSLLAGEQTS
ncbi:hypothetical protein QBC41DRAFT_365454 [Cercophora samala]|uniref:Uncharacterized protein n=1 Tax=Cercophora samala TaxID=330535 RepID=A0AA39ZCM6_9PEZI|nr:hypothetical protein QBC41DRAFT_365454 [Cercophora samala]